MNLKGKLISPFIYEKAYDFSEGLATVKLNDKYGFIDEKGKMVISNIFDCVSDFKDGKSHVRILDKIFYIDKNGNELKNEESIDSEHSKRFMKKELLKRKRSALKEMARRDLVKKSRSKSYSLNNN